MCIRTVPSLMCTVLSDTKFIFWSYFMSGPLFSEVNRESDKVLIQELQLAVTNLQREVDFLKEKIYEFSKKIK